MHVGVSFYDNQQFKVEKEFISMHVYMVLRHQIKETSNLQWEMVVVINREMQLMIRAK